MLIKCEVIPYEKWYEEVRPEFINWDRRIGTYDTYLIKMADIYTEAIKGYHKSFIEHIVKKVVEDKGQRTYVYSRNMIKWHKDQGHKVITVSGSPEELVKEMANLYEFDDYIGAKYLLDEDDFYTGEIIPMWNQEGKQNAINYFNYKYDIDFENSYSYGDTSGDFTMLKAVGNPVCINPTRELIDICKNDIYLKEKASIIVERKDVTYKLKFEDLDII